MKQILLTKVRSYVLNYEFEMSAHLCRRCQVSKNSGVSMSWIYKSESQLSRDGP